MNFLYIIVLKFLSAPNIAIQITNSISGTIPTVGEDYNLICSVLGAENLNPTITYRWTKNGDMLQSIIGSNSNILSLIAPIRVSDAGTNYSCFITIASSYLTGNITAMTSHTVRIQSEFKAIVTYCVISLYVSIWSCSTNAIFNCFNQ